MKAVTPATLDVLLNVLSAKTVHGPTNSQRQEAARLKDLVLKCIVRMVHVIHECSPDQVESSLFVQWMLHLHAQYKSFSVCDM